MNRFTIEIHILCESSPSLSALANSGSASSGVGGVNVGMGSSSMLNTVVTGIGGTVMLPNSSSSSSSSSSTSSSNHMHIFNAAVVGSTAGGVAGTNSQCSTNGTNSNSNGSNNNSNANLNQTLLHPNNNGANGTTNLTGNNCSTNIGGGTGGPQEVSPQAPPTYVNL
ncbi:hypothetical protein DOY81_009214 [Sarcophaga bullata]|nr:hypothetical protein DOY81_009214 [Sarcophaga bullata]